VEKLWSRTLFWTKWTDRMPFQYPVSAVIAAEFASTDTRAVMMACVFLMQSIGRLMAVGIGLGSLQSLMQHYHLAMDDSDGAKAKIVIDMVWRIVIGMGGVL
jgi:MFS transporter, PHS family, inorganic phosphate transporter